MLTLIGAQKFTLREAAKLAGISESMMRQEIQRGAIPVLKIGTKSMVVEWDLENYLRRHYVVDAAGTAKSIGMQDLPEWVDESPFLQPKRKAS